jgi:hypothetical protein
MREFEDKRVPITRHGDVRFDTGCFGMGYEVSFCGGPAFMITDENILDLAEHLKKRRCGVGLDVVDGKRCL